MTSKEATIKEYLQGLTGYKLEVTAKLFSIVDKNVFILQTPSTMLILPTLRAIVDKYMDNNIINLSDEEKAELLLKLNVKELTQELTVTLDFLVPVLERSFPNIDQPVEAAQLFALNKYLKLWDDTKVLLTLQQNNN